MFYLIRSLYLSLRTDERMAEVPKVLCGVAVDVAHILAFEVELIGGSDVYGQVVKLVDDEIEVHGGRCADGPHGNRLTLGGIGKGEAVVHPSGGEVLLGGVVVLVGYLNGPQGIKYFIYMIPCNREKDRDAPRFSAYGHCEASPNHRSAFLRRPGSRPKAQVVRRQPSWRTIVSSRCRRGRPRRR